MKIASGFDFQDGMGTPNPPTDPRKSPEVGLAEVIADALNYVVKKSMHCGGVIHPPMPDEWPEPEYQHPDWRAQYRGELEANRYLASLLRGDGLGQVYEAAKLSKREQQVVGFRLAGMSWGQIAEEIQSDQGSSRKYWRTGMEKITARILPYTPTQDLRREF